MIIEPQKHDTAFFSLIPSPILGWQPCHECSKRIFGIGFFLGWNEFVLLIHFPKHESD